jgi:3-mercaptopyruvate sulfurtransferase SseA
VLSAELAGLGPTRLYPGSWSEWSRAGRPAAR